MTKKQRVVAAIDFGTHGTGFAWAPINPENEDLTTRRISYFEDWGGQRLASAKNRSALLLNPDGSVRAWGYQAMKEMDQMPKGAGWQLKVGFKMSLHRTAETAPASQTGAGLVIADGESDAFRLIVLCLERVYAQALTVITRGAYQPDEIRWCLTVPAIWDAYTWDLMVKAAVAAGLPDDPERLLIVQEPTAAALYCAAKGDQLLSEPGTRFMVIDAGGGTVDITSYQVGPDGDLDELAPATGAKTGSEYLNKAFMNDVLVGRFGNGPFNRILTDQREAVASTMEAWERAKRAFAPGDDDGEVVIPLSAGLYRALFKEHYSGNWPDSQEPDTEVAVSNRMISGLFEASIAETIKQVERQLSGMRTASGVTGGEIALLVGGFAESPFLQVRLGDHLADLGLRVVVPDRPSAAVLAGAVHFAYNPRVLKSWRAPFTLGIRISARFRTGIDPLAKQLKDADGGLLCKDRFDILVKNRDVVTLDETVERTYFPVSDDATSIELAIFSTPRTDVDHTDEPTVEPRGKLVVDLTPSMHLPRVQRSVAVTMTFTPSGANVTAKNVATGTPYVAEISWKPSW